MDKDYVVCMYGHRMRFGKLLLALDLDFSKVANKFTVHFSKRDVENHLIGLTRKEVIEQTICQEQLDVSYTL